MVSIGDILAEYLQTGDTDLAAQLEVNLSEEKKRLFNAAQSRQTCEAELQDLEESAQHVRDDAAAAAILSARQAELQTQMLELQAAALEVQHLCEATNRARAAAAASAAEAVAKSESQEGLRCAVADALQHAEQLAAAGRQSESEVALAQLKVLQACFCVFTQITTHTMCLDSLGHFLASSWQNHTTQDTVETVYYFSRHLISW